MNKNYKLSHTAFATRTIALFMCLAGMVLITTGCSSDLSPTATSNNSETGQGTAKAKNNRSRKFTRLFWQDRDQGLIHAADLCSTESGFEINKLEIAGINKLDDRNDFVQMVIDRGSLIAGVRDQADGTDMSGWLAIDSGVEEESHGDHSHWHYDSLPKLQTETLDADQGNPAHVYRYGDYVFIANDKKNGFSMIRSENGSSTARFFHGGGGHITLAAVGNQIAYSTWIDRTGDNAGRVDVVDLRSDDASPRYSFHLPAGGIHGATTCGNRVFFAPANGVYWVDCDFDFARTAETVEIHHLSLGTNEQDVYRTGAFESFRNHVLCIGNCKGCPPALCLIDGTAPDPKVHRFLCDDPGDGLRLGIIRATTVGGWPFAVAFAEGAGVEEKLLVFELDSNRDRKLGDIALIKSVNIGASEIEGHFGHHDIAFLNDQETAVITNPGDGTISVLNLVDWTVRESIEVGGQPTRIVSCGGKP